VPAAAFPESRCSATEKSSAPAGTPLAMARLGLLATVRDLGDGVLDWAELRLG